MVHGNCCCGGYFFFRKTFSHSLAQHVECVREHFFSFLFFFFVSLDIILSWRAHHDDRFPNLPKFDYRSAKTSNNAVASMSLMVTSQSPSLFYFSFSLPSFHPYDLKLRIKTQVMCFNRKHAQQIYGKEKKTTLGEKKPLDSDLCVVYIGNAEYGGFHFGMKTLK